MSTGTPVARPLTGLFLADVISTAGTEMSAVALPWFVLVTTGSPTRMGAVLAAEFVGMSVLGLWGGRVATAAGERRMMLGSDLSRAALIAVIPLAYWSGFLSFPLVLAIGVLVGAFFPAYASSQRLVLAGVVGDDELRLTRVGGLLGSVNESASFIGPALGGVLVVLIGAAAVLVLDALTYLAAFLLVLALVPSVAGPAEPDDSGRGIGAGLRYLYRHPVLRRQVLGMGIVEIGWAAMIATLPVLALRGGGAAVAGWLLGSFGAGSLVGGLISSRARTVDGRTGTWSVLGIAASTWLLLLPVPGWTLAGALAINGICNGLYFPRFFAGITTGTPPALRSRVMTSVNIAISAPGPLGFLGAGILSQLSRGTTASVLLAAVTATAGALVAARARTPAPAPV